MATYPLIRRKKLENSRVARRNKGGTKESLRGKVKKEREKCKRVIGRERREEKLNYQ